jgi:hypothetical protein
MLDFKKTTLKFKFQGEPYEINYPSVKQFDDYQKKASKAKESEYIELLIDFLSKLGLSKEVAYELEVDHLSALVEELAPNKKK